MSKVLFLSNLGSPKKPDPRSVGVYLKEFLMDPRVVDIAALWRWLLVCVIIVPIRKYRSAKAYQKVWLAEGPPLVVLTKRFTEKLAKKLEGKFIVKWAMRYSVPSLRSELEQQIRQLQADDQLYFIPLYPQYALSSTETSIDVLKDVVSKDKTKKNSIYFLQDFFDRAEFIQPLAAQIQKHMLEFRPDHLLFSYHGLPERHLKKLPFGDFCFSKDCCNQMRFENRLCYRAQATRTTQLLVHQLNLLAAQVSMSFQSRLGRTPWIQPFTDHQLMELAQAGIKRLAVVCPSFVTDCLETLEEIQIVGRKNFIAAGGEDLRLIPCLNDSDFWVEKFADMVKNVSWQKLS